MDQQEERLLRPDEVAVKWNVSRSKVYALLAAGVLPSVRIGHSVRIPAQALERWIEDQTRSLRHGKEGNP